MYLRRERRRNTKRIKKRKIKRVRRATKTINRLSTNRFKLSSKTRTQFIKRMGIRSRNKDDPPFILKPILYITIITYSLDIL
mgnify:CR=1 FL=1